MLTGWHGIKARHVDTARRGGGWRQQLENHVPRRAVPGAAKGLLLNSTPTVSLSITVAGEKPGQLLTLLLHVCGLSAQVVAPRGGSPLTFATIEEFCVGTYKSLITSDASPDVRQVCVLCVLWSVCTARE